MYASLGPSNDMPYSTAVIAATAQTVTPVAAVTSQIIRVYAVLVVPTAASSVTFQDSVGAFTGAMALTAGDILLLPNTGTPWFISAPGASFQIVNSASLLNGIIYYTQNKFQG